MPTVHSTLTSGSEPPRKKARGGVLMTEADRAQNFLATSQPGRVHPSEIGFVTWNRGGQGIMPPHCHEIALDISKNGTSERRYNAVKLVEVPQGELATWLVANKKKLSRINRWLSA